MKPVHNHVLSQLLSLSCLGVLALSGSAVAQSGRPPNIVMILADDLGYGDLGCFGHPTIRTPELDRMAREGQRWTDFYVCAPVCTPSRAGLLTGRLPIRTGMCSDTRHVLFPDSAGGLPAAELTIAEALRARGYATACVGKWHLGHARKFLPLQHGFDEFFGLPYSNDMTQRRRGQPPLPLFRGNDVVEYGVDQTKLTRRYTEFAIDFMRRKRDQPFFLYFPHTFPHVPLFASEKFRGKSPRGRYGDAVEELDWSVGRVLAYLRDSGLAKNTLVVFTSDNGPWLSRRMRGGSAGLLRGGKTTTWDGGMREPTVVWWPGRVPAASTVRGMGSTLDLLPTFCALAGSTLPKDLVLDGLDLSPALFGTGPSPRHEMFFYRGRRLSAVRRDRYKLHLWRRVGARLVRCKPPLLYDLGRDPSEQFAIGKRRPRVVDALEKLAVTFVATFVPPPSQLDLVAQLPKPIALFNGKDMTGWHADVPKADRTPDIAPSFVVRDGKLISLGTPEGHLITDKVFHDYRLVVEYRWPGEPGNCGVLVHASKPRRLYKMYPQSIECQMHRGNAGDFWCIGENLVVPDMEKRRGPKAKWGVDEGKARRILNLTDGSERPAKQWNQMVIECRGRSIDIWVNGDHVNHGTDCTADRGQIAIQAEGAVCEFRRVDLTPLKP